MLLVTAPHQVRVCLHCRLRTQQLALQARRLRSKTTSKGLPPWRRIDTSRERLRPREGPQLGSYRYNAAPDFDTILDRRLTSLRKDLSRAPVIELSQQEEQGDESDHDKSFDQEGGDDEASAPFRKVWHRFVSTLHDPEARTRALGGRRHDGELSTWYEDFQNTLATSGAHALDDRIKHAFYGHVVGRNFSRAELSSQTRLADLRYPSEWFPATRRTPRKIHLHVGPTNSGKTYHALKRLEQAKSGVYAGPLRLLAHEVYQRMNVKGLACALMTGEERRPPPMDEGKEIHQSPHLYSCTVEMVPTNARFDVAVIDEIQMLGDQERGWAWTSALLGVMAAEVHLCGEERTVPLIKEICSSLGEEVEIHRYKRLTGLEMDRKSLDGNLSNLRKGDCVVSFSVMGIQALRRTIERQTGKKVAIVYGSLPPETRAQQARLFNDPDNDYDFLVASDAIGMGLNLAVKRIIFETSMKFDGVKHKRLRIADIKQIGGRAGRYRTSLQAESTEQSYKPDVPPAEGAADRVVTQPPSQSSNVGYVTTLEQVDYPIVAAAMQDYPEPLQTAGIFPPFSIIERFGNYFPPGTPFSYIVTRLHELSQVHHRYHLCGLRDRIWLADILEPLKGLSITDRGIFALCPASRGDIDVWKVLLPALARHVAENRECNVADLEELPLELLETEVTADRDYLRSLERLHKGLVVYLWLSYRFAGVFNTRALAFHAKSLVEAKIEEALGKMSFSESVRRQRAAMRERDLLRDIEQSLSAVNKPRPSEVETSEEGHAHDSKTQQSAEPTVDGDQFSDAQDEIRLTEFPNEDAVAEDLERRSNDDLVKQFLEQSPGNAPFYEAEEADDLDTSIRDAQPQGVEHGIAAAASGDGEQGSDERPLVAEVMSEASAEEAFDTQFKPETDEGVDGPLKPQQLHRDGDPAKDTQSPSSHDKSSDSTVPLKHLVQIDADATEAEREVQSRP